ncbi:MAG TPA: protein kinase [Pyrinomonadaceae bacterium]
MSSPLPSGHRLGRYEIRSQIGAGGMGDVYLGHDSKLDRKVALKVLPVEAASDEDRMRRFIQEAKAAAALNHPHIAHVYEIDEVDGWNFIAMEFIDGITLRKKIHQERAELATLIKILQQVAEALAKAHAAGIVHRDLKPDNVMITHDGFAKVLDFGLAKLIEPQQSIGSATEVVTIMQQHSRPGLILGTVGYMSPEQAQGKTDEIDQRSDIFSFGCILFEAVTGRKAFDGKDAIESLNKIIREQVTPIDSLRPEIPTELQEMVRRCLAKDPDERYQSMQDVARELRGMEVELEKSFRADTVSLLSPSGGAKTQSITAPISNRNDGRSTAGTPHSQSATSDSIQQLATDIKQHKLAALIIASVAIVAIGGAIFGLRSYFQSRGGDAAVDSIAVLPFVNQNNDPEMEYRSDGLTESIINSLAQLPNVRVIARSSVFRYKGKEVDPLEAGKKLGVRAVLTGRIMQRGDDLIISTELLDVQDNKQLWGEHYNRKVSDLLNIQRTIAGEITTNLRLKLSGPEQSRVTKNYTEDAEANQLYMKGRFHWNKRNGESLERSVEYFNQALARDPGYALSYAGLADAWFSRGWYRYVVPKEAYERAKAAATRALELDAGLAEAHTILAAIKTTYDWDWAGAEKEFNLAIQLNPNYATAHQRYSLFLPITGRFQEAVAEAQKARDLDPLSLPANENLGDILYLARRYEEAEQQLKKTIELDPNYGVAHSTLSKVYEAKGLHEEALNARLRNASPENAQAARKIYASGGIKGVWRDRLNQLLERAKKDYVSPADIALFYARLNEKDNAFVWLDKAMEERSILFNYLVADARFDNIRADARFPELLKRVGLEPLR